MYDTLEDFLADNPGWIDKHEHLPEEETKVRGLVWMFGNFIIDDVWYINEHVGWRTYLGKNNEPGEPYWSEKVTHWKY